MTACWGRLLTIGSVMRGVRDGVLRCLTCLEWDYWQVTKPALLVAQPACANWGSIAKKESVKTRSAFMLTPLHLIIGHTTDGSCVR